MKKGNWVVLFLVIVFISFNSMACGSKASPENSKAAKANTPWFTEGRSLEKNDDFESTVLIMKKKEKQKYYDYGKEEDDNNKDLELTLLERVPVFDILAIKPNPKAKNIVSC